MIEIAERDFRPIEQFGLRWRWTDTQRAQIRPLSTAKASELSKRTVSWVEGSSLTQKLFKDLSHLDADKTTPSAVKSWLQQKDVALEEPIVVLWGEQLAVSTCWTVFCNYWDDFCYPVSDDVLVFPTSEYWALFYHHEEKLCFGVRAT